MAQLLSEEDFADSTTNPNAMLLSESDFADSSDALRKRLRLKDSLLNKIGYVKNRTKDDTPDEEGLTLDDYGKFVQSTDFNALDDERLADLAKQIDTKHASVAKKDTSGVTGVARNFWRSLAKGYSRFGTYKAMGDSPSAKLARYMYDAPAKVDEDYARALNEQNRELEETMPTFRGGVQNVRSVSDAANYALGGIAENLPSTVDQLGKSLAGGIAAGPIGARAMAAASGYDQNRGEAISDQIDDGVDKIDFGLARKQAIGYSIVDYAFSGAGYVGRKLAGKVTGQTLKEAKKNFIQSISGAAVSALKAGGEEAINEPLQSQVVGRLRRKEQTGSALRDGETTGDAVMEGVNEAIGGFITGFALGGGTSVVELKRNQSALKKADKVISRMSVDDSVASVQGFDKKLVADYMIGMSVMSDVDAKTQDAIRSKQAEIMDVADGKTKAILNAYQSMFTDASFDNIPDTVKPTFNAKKAYESKIEEQDGSETYFDADSGIMIQGREGAWSVFNRNGMKMPLTEENNVKTIKDAIVFAQNLTRLNQWRIENNQAKSEFIQKLAEKNHPGANVVMVDSPLQIKDEGIRSRFIGNEHGFYNPQDNTVYMMLDAVQNPAQAAIILAHEDTHRGLMDVLKKGGLIEDGETVNEAKQRLFGADNSSDAEKSEEQIARTGEQWQGNRGKLAKMRDTMQAWLYQKTGTRTVIGNADVRIWLDTIEQASKASEGGKVEYQPEVQSDANKIRYEDAKNGRLTLEEEAQRQNDAAPDEKVSQERVINRDTRRAGLVAGMNQPVEPSVVVDTQTPVGEQQEPLLSTSETQEKPSTVRSFVKTELRTDRIKEKHADLFQQALDVTDNDEQAAAGLVSEWLAGQNIADKSIPDSVRVASKLEQKADLTAKDADTLEQNAVFGKDLFMFGYRKDKETGAWKFQQPVQEAPQSTPVEPVASEPDIGTLQWYESELVSQRTRLRVKQRDWSKANKLSKEPKPETDNPFTSELYDVEKTLRQTRQSIYKADQSLKPVFGEKTEKESFKAFFEAMNQTGEFDLLQHWHEGRGLFSSPKKGSGGEYDAYRSLSKTMRKMIVWKSKQSIDQAAGEIAGLPWGKPEYGDSSVGPEMLVSDWVYQYNVYQQWKAEGSPSRSDIEGKRYEAEHRQEQEDLATYKQKVDNGEVIAYGSFIAVRTGADTVRMAGVDPEWPIVRVERSRVVNGILVYDAVSPSGSVFTVNADEIEADLGKETEVDDEAERNSFESSYELSELAARKVREDRERDYERDEREAIEGEPPLRNTGESQGTVQEDEVGKGKGKVAPRGKNNGSLFDEGDLDFNLDGGEVQDTVRIAAEKKAEEDRQKEAKRKLDAAPVLPGVDPVDNADNSSDGLQYQTIMESYFRGELSEKPEIPKGMNKGRAKNIENTAKWKVRGEFGKTSERPNRKDVRSILERRAWDILDKASIAERNKDNKAFAKANREGSEILNSLDDSDSEEYKRLWAILNYGMNNPVVERKAQVSKPTNESQTSSQPVRRPLIEKAMKSSMFEERGSVGSVDITDDWKSMTPKERQDAQANGLHIETDRMGKRVLATRSMTSKEDELRKAVMAKAEERKATPNVASATPNVSLKRGTKVATTRNADGVSYFGEVLQSNPDGTVKIRAFKEKTKGTIGAKGYGVDSKGNQVTKDIDVPAESVKSVDATADTSKLSPEEKRKLKMAEAVDAANADNELSKGSAVAAPDIVDKFNDAKERKEQRKTDNGNVMFRHAIADKGYFEASNALVTKPGEVRFRRAYHGSPHLFNRFDISKIGTGEGAQAYGWGLYFADEKEVAKVYQKLGKKELRFNGNPIGSLTGTQEVVLDAIEQFNGDWEAAKSWFQSETRFGYKGGDAKRVRILDEFKEIGPKVTVIDHSALYEVDIDVEDNELLDLDAPLSKQSDKVRAALGPLLEAWVGNDYDTSRIGGQQIYNRAAIIDGGSENASSYLNSIGIKGIKYADQMSRTGDYKASRIWENEKHPERPQWQVSSNRGVMETFMTEDEAKEEARRLTEESRTYNYVIFDDNLIKITKRNDQEAKGYDEDGGVRFRRSSVTPEQDAEYLDSVERGDMETAQRMVDEAAKKAGYTTVGYHGARTGKLFHVFDGGKHFFSSDPEVAKRFAQEGEFVLVIDGEETPISRDTLASVLIEPYENADWHLGWNWVEEEGTYSDRARSNLSDWFPQAESAASIVVRKSEAGDFVLKGYLNLGDYSEQDYGGKIWSANNDSPDVMIGDKDGFVARNIQEGGVTAEPEFPVADTIVVAAPSQIKSADAVTRDDQGNVIPLSQRFNSESNDIRFRRSMAGTPSGADILDTETGLQAARRIVQDYMQPWERKQESLQKTLKRKLSDDVDVYRAEDRSYGLIRNGVHQFEKNFIDKAEKVLNENGLTVDEFDQFLMAKAGPARNQMIAERTDGKNLTGSGQSDVYWNNILAAYRKQGKYDKLNEAAEHVWALNRAVLDMKVEAGLMSKAQVDVWKTKSPFYVPLRSDDAEADYKELGKRASFSLKRKESKSATGRAEGHEADTPFAFSVMQSLEAVGRANKNVVYETAAKLIEQNPSDLWHIAKRIPTKHAYDADTGKVISVPDAQFEDAPNVVIVKRDGKKQYLVFEGADGLKLARSLKKDSLQKAPAMVSALTRTYAMMRTAMVPTFILRNLRADFLQLTINMTAENKARMVPEVFKSMKDSWQAVWSYERDGKASGALAGYANEFFSNGGQIAGVGVQTVDKINQTLNKHVKKHGAMMQKVMKAEHFYEYIERGNATIETGTRLALYATLRKQGFSISDSIEAGKNITVNFNRKGELGPLVNSLYMFSNVAVQDAARSVKALSGKNGKAVVLGLLGAGFLVAMLNNGDDDEEDKTGAGNYKNIPEYDKQRNIIIKVGGKYIKQPIRGIWAWVYYAGTKAGDVAFGKYDSAKAAKNVAVAAFDTINFLGTSGSVAQFVTPTILDPVVQHIENKDWKGAPMRQRKFTDAQPDSATGMKRTPEWIKATAKGLNRLTGGDDATKGLIDVAPETIKHVIDTMTGGLGTDASYAVGAVSDAAKGNFYVDKTPFVRDVVRDLPDSTREYYVAKDKFEAGVYAVNHYKTAKERSAYYRKNPFMKPSLADRIKNLNKTIKEIRESESKTDNADRKKILEARRLRLQSTMLRLMDT